MLALDSRVRDRIAPGKKGTLVKLRCVIDGLLLDARLHPARQRLQVFDGGESFLLEAVEAIFYELVAADEDELLQLQEARYRLLRLAADFQSLPG
jgi:hypothetical protein